MRLAQCDWQHIIQLCQTNNNTKATAHQKPDGFHPKQHFMQVCVCVLLSLIFNQIHVKQYDCCLFCDMNWHGENVSNYFEFVYKCIYKLLSPYDVNNTVFEFLLAGYDGIKNNVCLSTCCKMDRFLI